LASDNRKTLRFSHFSVKEYLVSSRISEPLRPPSLFAIVEGEAHLIATTICVIYLIATPHIGFDANPFFRYSAEIWYQHFQHVPDKSRQQLELDVVTRLFLSPSDIERWLSIHNPDSDVPSSGPSPLCGCSASPFYFSSRLGLEQITTALIAQGVDVIRKFKWAHRIASCIALGA
jgi:hypothetical protein